MIDLPSKLPRKDPFRDANLSADFDVVVRDGLSPVRRRRSTARPTILTARPSHGYGWSDGYHSKRCGPACPAAYGEWIYPANPWYAAGPTTVEHSVPTETLQRSALQRSAFPGFVRIAR